MKIYIAVDMEGATGICSNEQCKKGAAAYAEALKYLAADVNAAIEGALAAGAKEIFVADLHADQHNLSPGDLHPKANLIFGSIGSGPRLPYLDDSFAGVFLIAYHAKAGTLAATLEHTWSPDSWHKLTVNGKEIGEIGMDAALAGAAGVPVILVTGDDKACLEARELLGPIATAEVKKGLARTSALCLPPPTTKKLIYASAKKALSLKRKIRPFSFGSPVDIALVFKHTDHADNMIWNNCLEQRRKDGYTVAAKYKTFSDWLGGIWRK